MFGIFRKSNLNKVKEALYNLKLSLFDDVESIPIVEKYINIIESDTAMNVFLDKNDIKYITYDLYHAASERNLSPFRPTYQNLFNILRSYEKDFISLIFKDNNSNKATFFALYTDLLVESNHNLLSEDLGVDYFFYLGSISKIPFTEKLAFQVIGSKYMKLLEETDNPFYIDFLEYLLNKKSFLEKDYLINYYDNTRHNSKFNSETEREMASIIHFFLLNNKVLTNKQSDNNIREIDKLKQYLLKNK